MIVETYILKNQIRLVHVSVKSEVAHCGVIINAGSRDEKNDEHGLAHFIEHTLFKGTYKRKAFHVIDRLESVGGEINAYTTKEETCIYSSFLKEDYARAIELLGDILFNSSFPEKELEKEKEIIIDEINSYKDSPAELIYDDFEELIYKNKSIGRNILGNKKNIKRFTKKNIIEFIDRNYLTSEIIISSVGNISFDKLVKLVEKYLGDIQPNIHERDRNEIDVYVPQFKKVRKRTHQLHCILGNIAYKVTDNNRLGLVLLNNVLGSHNFNSRLNLLLREKYGYAYNIDSTYTPYSDTGVFSIYIGLDKENLDKSFKLIKKVLDDFRNTKLSTKQLLKAQKQLLGQMAIYSDNLENSMLSNAKSMLVFNKIDTFEEVKSKINEITAESLMGIANDIFKFDDFSKLIYY